MAAADDLDEGLLDQLAVEFLDHGRQAMGFLRSAQALLVAPPAGAPHTAEMVAYCLREAMQAILESQDTGGSGQWRTRSCSVVEAKQCYERTRDLPGENNDAILQAQNVLSRLNEAIHYRVSIDEARQMWADCLTILRQLFLSPDFDWKILNRLILVGGPVCAIQILFIAWSVTSHKSPEARQDLFEILAIISIIIAIMPAFNKVAGKFDK